MKIEYKLENPFEYAHKGSMTDAGFIELRSPTVDNIANVSKLKQGFMQAISDSSNQELVNNEKDSKEASAVEFTGPQIMMALSMSNIDYSEYMLTARKVFIGSGVARINGDCIVTKELINKMSVEDLEAMTGEYLNNFILTSVLKMMQT